ncbi:hypothetical protein A1O7_09084 [Cladophialophora yegresii CBS 114405]|uniref:Uncharacterized protein n=1 Tax=Cladophialophora yegresii CBS 114405 TaxID=1182544 RepID=W9VKW9_9EURO|nr:uncharacterized protein A1O7_09084 [Cladophialophora yegresii CBS 114405]EXJ56153.1 hypothetical protein A1O7_09084 [Cladophialophora yegresii CBS 114405]
MWGRGSAEKDKAVDKSIRLAEGAVIQSTGAVDDLTTVQFYSSDDCSPGTEITRADDGCVTVDNGAVGAYNSFQVISSNPLGSRAPTRRPPAQRRRHFQNTTFQEPHPSSPILYHGMIATFDGIEYKWQQIHATGYIGILPHTWDDVLHARNTTEMSTDNGGDSEAKDLEERNLSEALCSTFTTCKSAIRVTGNGVATVGQFAGPYFASAGQAALKAGVSVNDFLNNNPFIAQLAAGGATGLVSAWVGAKLQGDSKNCAACSTQNEQVDALISIIQSQNSALNAASATVTAQVDNAADDVFSLTMTVVTCGQSLTATGCGIPAGFCTSI